MDNFTVKVWEIRTKGRSTDPDFIFNIIAAKSPEMALRQALEGNDIHGVVYAEVIWNNEKNEQERQKFENYSL